MYCACGAAAAGKGVQVPGVPQCIGVLLRWCLIADWKPPDDADVKKWEM